MLTITLLTNLHYTIISNNKIGISCLPIDYHWSFCPVVYLRINYYCCSQEIPGSDIQLKT